MRYDMLVYHGTIITVNPDFDIIENGAIFIKDGKIVRIENQKIDATRFEAAEKINANGGIVMPGLVNTHTHLPMTLFRGLADDLPLLEWLNEHIFPAERKYISPESSTLGALLGCAEMICGGTTTCCDGYFYEDAVADAVSESGMRAVLGQGVIDFPAPGVSDPSENIRHAQRFVEKWQGASPLISPSIFCHSPYTCSPETLQKAKAAAASEGILFQIHTAETKSEWEQIHSEHGVSPVQYLDRLGILDRNSLLVHAVWVDDRDIDIIAGQKAAVVHSPESNMKLGAGIAPVPELIASGIPVGLGTDGCASNNNLDLFQEMDVAAKLHKVHTLNPTVMDARTVLEMATIRGAAAAGLEKETGSIEIGKQADLIVIDTDQPHLIPMYHPVSQMVYAARGSDVCDVVVSGRHILKNRKLQTIDLAKVARKAAEIGRSILHSPSNSVKAKML